jgi:hypothetical protein
MFNRLQVFALLVAALMLSVIAGTIVYFNVAKERNSNQVNNQSQVSTQTSLKAQILSLNDQLVNLTKTVENLTSANLVASLETNEMIGANSSYMGGLVSTPVPYNYLWIAGSVTNAGKATLTTLNYKWSHMLLTAH